MKKFKDLECILLIDDNELTNFVHTKVIQKSEIETTIIGVTNVEDALDFLTQKGEFENTAEAPRPGIIFLDINMPGLTGWDFMEYYRNIDSALRAKVIVVMLTTSLNPEDREKALLDGQIVDFLPKPLRSHMLDDLVEKYFEPQ